MQGSVTLVKPVVSKLYTPCKHFDFSELRLKLTCQCDRHGDTALQTTVTDSKSLSQVTVPQYPPMDDTGRIQVLECT